jgi:hypothetical protein
MEFILTFYSETEDGIAVRFDTETTEVEEIVIEELEQKTAD